MEPKSLNEWWDKQPDELKQAFTFLPDERWEEADLYLRINIRNYCCLKKEKLLPEDKERSMLIWGIERSGFFNGREKWAKGFENQRV